MAKGNFISRFFQKRKVESLRKQLKKMKDRYDYIGERIASGIAFQKEQNEYFKLEEDIKTMVKKFKNENGTIELVDVDETKQVKEQQVVQPQKAQPQQTPIQTRSQQIPDETIDDIDSELDNISVEEQAQQERNIARQEIMRRQELVRQQQAYQQAEAMKQQAYQQHVQEIQEQSQQQAQLTPEQIQYLQALEIKKQQDIVNMRRQQAIAQQQQAMAQQQEAYKQHEEHMRQQAIQEQYRRRAMQEQAMMEQEMQEPVYSTENESTEEVEEQQVETEYVRIILFVSDMPHMDTRITKSNLNTWVGLFEEACLQNKLFSFGDLHFIGSKLIGFMVKADE
jgi:hypothetical protein